MRLRVCRDEYLVYCLSCGRFESFDMECKHKWMYILFEINGGKTQLRQYCKRCHDVSKPLKQGEVDLSKVERRLYSDYKEYVGTIDNTISELIHELSNIRKNRKEEDYKKYMSSDKWWEVREKVMYRDSNICQICGDPAAHVHHLTYEHFKDEFLFELVSLCKKCHHKHYHNDLILQSKIK